MENWHWTQEQPTKPSQNHLQHGSGDSQRCGIFLEKFLQPNFKGDGLLRSKTKYMFSHSAKVVTKAVGKAGDCRMILEAGSQQPPLVETNKSKFSIMEWKTFHSMKNLPVQILITAKLLRKTEQSLIFCLNLYLCWERRLESKFKHC